MRKARGLWVALLVLAAAALLSACGGAVAAVVNTDQALDNAGYGSVHVGPSSSGSVGDTLDVTVSVKAAPSQAAATDVASIVWQNFHERFDYLDLEVKGDGQSLKDTFTFDQLQQDFGPRNPSWNKTTLRSGAIDVVIDIAIGLAVVALVIVGIVVLARRRRRRRRAGQWAPGGWQPAGGGWSRGAWRPPGTPGPSAPSGPVARSPSHPAWPAPEYPPRREPDSAPTGWSGSQPGSAPAGWSPPGPDSNPAGPAGGPGPDWGQVPGPSRPDPAAGESVGDGSGGEPP